MVGPILSIVLLAAVPSPRVFTVEPGQSRLTYSFDHALHEVRGESVSIEAKLMLWPDGKTQLMVRTPVASFKSGDANRDVHMQEVIEAAQHPYVILKAVIRLPEQPRPPGPWPLQFKGQLDFHGHKQMENIALKAQLTNESAVVVTGSFVVSLEKYKVERPSLLFLKLNDDCLIDFKLKLVEKKK